MRTRTLVTLMLALATLPSCSAISRTFDSGDGGSGSTSVYGHWVLATPLDSTVFAGATQVELVLAPGTFNVSATYPGRAPLAINGRAELATGGLLTLVPGSGDVSSVGLANGQPLTRLATASGGTLVLALPTTGVALPSSVWHRLEAARAAGRAR